MQVGPLQVPRGGYTRSFRLGASGLARRLLRFVRTRRMESLNEFTKKDLYFDGD